MPKGFTRKGIEGFSQWMTAIMEDSGLDKAKVKTAVENTKKLLDKGFPKARKQ